MGVDTPLASDSGLPGVSGTTGLAGLGSAPGRIQDQQLPAGFETMSFLKQVGLPGAQCLLFILVCCIKARLCSWPHPGLAAACRR